MNRRLGSSSILILILIAVIAVTASTYLPFLGTARDAGTLTSLQQGTDEQAPPEEVVIPTIALEAGGTIIYHEPEPTATDIPFPTPPPTPVVMRIPLVGWPAIPDPGVERVPYTIYYGENEAISMVSVPSSDASSQQETSANLHEATGLYLADTNIMWWGDVSPNGQQIAVVMSNQEMPSRGRREDGNRVWSIYLYDVAKKSMERLVDNGLYPKWSNDGSRIAYFNLATRSLGIINPSEQSAIDIFTIQLDDPEHSYAFESELNWITWSPDDQFIAMVQTVNSFASSGGIWIVDSATGKESRQVADTEMYAGGTLWSPKGNQVLFFSTRDTVPNPNLWLLDTVSEEIRRLTDGMFILDGIWLPDGSTIIMSGINIYEGEQESYDLWLLTPETKQIRRLTDDRTTNNYNLQLTSDATRILFNRFAKDGQELGIWELNLSSGELRQVMEGYPGNWMIR